MRNYIIIFIVLILSLFVLTSYAIQVSVQTASSKVAALGFTVNGKSHGGAGKSYSKSNLPAGKYSFGVRIGSVFGKDVGCTYKGNQNVTLNGDTTAVLNFNGQTCSLKIHQK